LILHGLNAILCPFDRRHADQTRAWVNDVEVARLLDRARPVSDADHERWFNSITGRDDCVFFAIEALPGKQHAGNVWLWDIDARHRKAEVRILIGTHQHQGRGLGSEALALLADFARERLHLQRLYAFVLSTNPRARRAFEKAGFELEGVLRQDRWVGDRFADVYLLGRLLSAPSSSWQNHQAVSEQAARSGGR
jgi:RimJ/RimL family protein N-acetyltransferase